MPTSNPAQNSSNARLAAACASGVLMLSAIPALAADTLSQWRDYARQGIAPEYSWSDAPAANAPDLLGSLRRARAAPASLPRPSIAFRASYGEAPSGYSEADMAVPGGGLLSRERSAIRSQFVSSSFVQDFGQAGLFQLTAVVAHQRYASAGFGTLPWSAREEIVGMRSDLPQESSSGHGVRVDYSAPVSDAFAWNVMLQSRLDMDAFESYRGIYSEAGDFDLPARMQSQLQWNLGDSAALAVGVERVFYSDISAFTSATLPIRFLSLLGDSTSPEFAWRDLTVYSVEGAVADAAGGEWSLRYTTRQQPSPTSAVLERAIEPDFTDTNVAFGYRRGLGTFGQLVLAASYAPSRYFLGASPYLQRSFDASGSQMEFEAMWAIPF